MQVAAFLKQELWSFRNTQARMAPISPSVRVNYCLGSTKLDTYKFIQVHKNANR